MPLLIVSQTKPHIGGVELDLTLSEDHGVENDITEHPVADDADQTDHAKTRPRVVTLTGIVTPTATSIEQLVAANLNPDKHTKAWVEFREMAKRHDTVTVYTTLEVYTNMMIQSLRAPRAPGRGDTALFVTCTLKRIQTGDVAEQNSIPDDLTDISAPDVDLGTQGTSEIT